MRRSFLPLAVFALAACSQSEPAPGETATAAPTQTTAPAATPTARMTVLPERFQGIWGDEKGGCDPASELRVEIAERGITFYESHGAVTALTLESPEAIVVDLAMQGEGEKWTMRRRFTLSNGDRTLTAGAVGEEPFEPMPLKRCA